MAAVDVWYRARPDTTVRLQTDLSSTSEEPDLLIRDLRSGSPKPV